jgi:hypothetical protein
VTATAGRPEVAAGRGRSLLGALLAGLLVFNGLLTLVLEVLFLPSYIGSIPFPITAGVAAVVNVLLVLGMGTVVARPGAMSMPLLAWLFGFLICSTGGPGGDVLLADNWTTPLLLACGLIPAGFYLFRLRFLRPQS